MLNFCGIVVAILKMATDINFSMSGINSGHHYLPTYNMMSRIDSWHRKISTGRHFQNGNHNTAQIQHCSISTSWIDSQHLAAKQAWKARRRLAILPVSKARTNKFYIYRQCTYIVYIFVHSVDIINSSHPRNRVLRDNVQRNSGWLVYGTHFGRACFAASTNELYI
jgi:hypothetical protein